MLPRARQLLVDGRPVELGSRAFDLLMVLIRAPGVLLTKNEIISRVWPDVVVEQNNLKVQVAALRKVLNQDRDGAPQPVLHSADLEHDLVQRHRQLDWLRSKSSASRGGLGR